MKELKIREDIPSYLSELTDWLNRTRQAVPEEMEAFFAARIDGYEEHMRQWEKAYRRIGEMIPETCGSLLDLGCGTGLELDEILKRRKGIRVTGIDLCEKMLDRLKEKHPEVRAICADYFSVPFGENCFDSVISVESFHHFDAPQKQKLFEKIRRALKDGGQFIECDYIACCEEEEELLEKEYSARRRNAGLAAGAYIHFDRPLTLEHETGLMHSAAFSSVSAAGSIDGATFIVCTK